MNSSQSIIAKLRGGFLLTSAFVANFVFALGQEISFTNIPEQKAAIENHDNASNQRTKTVITSFPLLKDVDLNTINPDLFSEDEWFMPYYLKHFSKVANAVIDSGQDKGFIDISVWRPEDVNKTFNARIMESILSLAWFYSQKRSWNPYYNDPALKVRLEAAILFWCKLQNPEGKFSEYSETRFGLAPTAFATKFVGRALFLLADGPAIDPDVFQESVHVLRKTLYNGFKDDNFWRSGRDLTNQYANFWGGALMYLEKWPDEELNKLFHQRFYQSLGEFQSSCGFFYEKGGPDWNYNLSTHHSDLQVAWEYVKGTIAEKIIIEKTQNWYDWFTYNAVKEPGNDCFYLNRAIETRTNKGFYKNTAVEDPAHQRWTPQAKYAPAARAFQLNNSEYIASNASAYKKMRSTYPEVPPLQVGEFWTYSPYAFLHLDMELWHPTPTQKNNALQELPYLKYSNFLHVRHCNRSDMTFSYVKRPGYYAIFNSGKIITDQQRLGLGLIWNPTLGTVFQSQSETDIAGYGTKKAGSDKVYEASDLYPEFLLNNQKCRFIDGKNNLPEGELSITYKLGNEGVKTIQFKKDKILVDIEHKGSFSEIIPLLISDRDQLIIKESLIELKNKNVSMLITFTNGLGIKAGAFDTELNKKQCEVLDIKAFGKLHYEIYFVNSG